MKRKSLVGVVIGAILIAAVAVVTVFAATRGNADVKAAGGGAGGADVERIQLTP
jgi:hypothetical protein